MGYAHGIRWTEGKVIEELLRVMRVLNLNRMPSRSEICKIRKDEALHNAICRRGGYKYYSEKLNLKMKDSETKLGWDAEEIAKVSMETSLGYKVEKMSTKHPYDLLVNDFIKVDVKCARPFYIKGDRVHTFGISKKFSTCDLYIIYALDKTDRIERTFIIPGHELRVVTMCIGKETKYQKYLERWDYFEKYNEFYRQLSI